MKRNFAIAAVALLPILSQAQTEQPTPTREREETRYRSESSSSDNSDRNTRQSRSRDRSYRQTKYLFGDWRSTGAFGSVFVEYGEIKGNSVSFTGGGGAIIINETFLLGGYGQGLNGKLRLLPNDATLFNGQAGNLDMSHGGFWLGGVILPRAAVHPVVTTRLGWGGAEWSGSTIARDAIFVVTPMVGVQANINSWMRINLEGGYRIVTGLNLPGIGSRSLDGYSVGLSFQFGDFD
jgi:hypothetical protein